MRAFIAADIPPACASGIATWQEGLKKNIKGVRWVNPVSIHLTLRFLGEASEEQIGMVREILTPACRTLPPLKLSVGAPGAFPGERRPRVIWLGLDGDLAELATLQQQVEKGCERAGFPPEERGFKPHLTVGRVGIQGGKATGIAAAVKGAPLPDFEPFTVRGVHIYRSELAPQGAIYRKLETILLEGEREGGRK